MRTNSRPTEQVPAGRAKHTGVTSGHRDLRTFADTRQPVKQREAVDSRTVTSTVRLSRTVQATEKHSDKSAESRPGAKSVYSSQTTPENRLVTTSLETLLLCHYDRVHLENYRQNDPQNYQLNHRRQHYRPSDPTFDRLTARSTLQMLGQFCFQFCFQFGRLFALIGQLFCQLFCQWFLKFLQSFGQLRKFHLSLFGLRGPQAFRGFSRLYQVGYRLAGIDHQPSKRYHLAARLSNFQCINRNTSSNLSGQSDGQSDSQSACNERPGCLSEHNHHYERPTAYQASNQRPTTYRLQTASMAAIYQWTTCNRSASRQPFADHPPSTNHQQPDREAANDRLAFSSRPAFTSPVFTSQPATSTNHRPSASRATYQPSCHQPAIQQPSVGRARRCTHQFSNLNRTNLFNLRTFIRCLLPSLLGALVVLPNQPVNGQAPANPETPFGEYPSSHFTCFWQFRLRSSWSKNLHGSSSPLLIPCLDFLPYLTFNR